MKSSILLAAAAALVLPAGAHAIPALYGTTISDSSEALTATELASFLGAPDDLHTGLGGGFVTYDLGDFRIFDGAGQDFNVYELDGGGVEFTTIDILVSANGIDFFNVEATAAAALDLDGDEAHGNASFRQSYDIGGAVAALGVTQFRYLRIDGTAGGTIGAQNGFDLDAIGIANFVSAAPVVPEPASWAMMIAGFGLVGGAMRRGTARAVVHA